MQEDLFSKDKTMGKFLFRLFIIANAADYNRRLKQVFYSFKNSYLKEHGALTGYIRQLIPKYCWTCGGTGIFTFYDWETGEISGTDICNNCFNGIHHYDIWYLLTYNIYNKTFHIPEYYEPVNCEEIGKMKGKIKHGVKYSSIQGKAACFILLLYFRKKLLKDYFVKGWNKYWQSRYTFLRLRIYKIKKTIIHPVKTYRDYISDLPF